MAKSKPKGLSVSSKYVDPTLAALFSESAGPTVPSKSRSLGLTQKNRAVSQLSSKRDGKHGSKESEKAASGGAEDEQEESLDHESEAASDASSDEGSGKDEQNGTTNVLEDLIKHGGGVADGVKKRRRKQKHDENDDLESRYLQGLEDDEEPAAKRAKNEARVQGKANGTDTNPEANDDKADELTDEEVPLHESLATDSAGVELDKANRTVFLSNVSTDAITSRKAKKALLTHLSSVLDKSASPPQIVESIRFRSTAYSTAAIPKRAAFAQKSVMDATTKSTNAYAVYSVASAVRTAVSKLNGTVVLDRHLRVDSVAHPAAVDHRRCVFVGNLGFVDDESVLNTKLDEEGKEMTEKRKRTKTPMDVEEGLWRVFNDKAGKVESVRVVRDAATRVGKGFAYVQFYDANAVESALTLAGKKFPPMLPRELRVNRCMAPHKTARAQEAKRNKAGDRSKPDQKSTKYKPKPTAEAQTLAGRAGRLLGRAAAVQLSGNSRKNKRERGATSHASGKASGAGHVDKRKTPEDIVFEGRRASAKDGKPKDLKFKGSKSGGGRRVQKKGRSQTRAAKWKAEKKGKVVPKGNAK